MTSGISISSIFPYPLVPLSLSLSLSLSLCFISLSLFSLLYTSSFYRVFIYFLYSYSPFVRSLISIFFTSVTLTPSYHSVFVTIPLSYYLHLFFLLSSPYSRLRAYSFSLHPSASASSFFKPLINNHNK